MPPKLVILFWWNSGQLLNQLEDKQGSTSNVNFVAQGVLCGAFIIKTRENKEKKCHVLKITLKKQIMN